jgi:hypothetical protein
MNTHDTGGVVGFVHLHLDGPVGCGGGDLSQFSVPAAGPLLESRLRTRLPKGAASPADRGTAFAHRTRLPQ